MADEDAPTPTEAARVLAEVGDRAAAAAPAPPAEDDAADDTTGDTADAGAAPAVQMSPESREALAAARHHLDAAWHSSDAGTEIPEAARLRQVKRAVMMGLRPVTSHQVPFNRELVVAIDRLARVVEELAGKVDRADERVDATVARVQAGIATVELGSAELEDEVGRLVEQADDLLRRLDAAEEDLARQRQVVGATRAREDLVLRAARDAVAAVDPGAVPARRPMGTPRRSMPGTVPAGGERIAPTPAGLGALAAEADRGDADLLRRLAAAGRPDPEDLRAQGRAVADAVVAATVAAPVLDLASDGGDWLDLWAELGVDATGVDDDPAAVAALRARGHQAVEADPVTHLGQVPDASLGAITAAVLADVRPLADLVDLVDRARAALRPGGLLVLVAALPATQATGDAQWADPRRHPLHPRTLTTLVLERGYAEVEQLDLGSAADPAAARSYAVLARTAGAAPTP